VSGTKKLGGAIVAAMALSAAVPAAASAQAGLAPAPGGPFATGAIEVEALVSYTRAGKLKAQRRLAYTGVCSADCTVTATTVLVLPGPNIAPPPVSGSFPAGQGFEAFIKISKAAAAFLKKNKGKSKLVTKIQAVNTLTGDTDTDKRNYKFK
jgi:hypothetical protein